MGGTNFVTHGVTAQIVRGLESELTLGNVDKCGKVLRRPIEPTPLVGSAEKVKCVLRLETGIGFEEPVCVLRSDLSQLPTGCACALTGGL